MAIRNVTGKYLGEIEKRAINRRDFLKLAATSAAVSCEVVSPMIVRAAAPSEHLSSGSNLLPTSPTPADLASDRLVHHFRDYFNPPLAQNELGCLQVSKSVAGITAITFPPFSCCSGQGNLITCEIFMDDQLLARISHRQTVDCVDCGHKKFWKGRLFMA